MSLPLPNLDDRRWADLIEEGQALIPFYAPEWTDHNVHDPGITLMELLAWIAEMDLYQLNRIPERHKRKFLILVGITPEPPRPAQTVLSFSLRNDVSSPLILPATMEFAGNDPFGQETRFCTLGEINVVPGELAAIQFEDQKGFHNLTSRWRRGEPIALFGDDPKPGAELYLGFSQALLPNTRVSLFFTGLGLREGEKERMRLIQEANIRREACCPLPLTCEKKQPPSSKEGANNMPEKESEKTPPHHSVRTVWEFPAEEDRWQALDPAQGQIEDSTCSFTLNGRVLIKIPNVMMAKRIGVVEQELYYIRCRFVSGAYDAPPILQDLVMNGVSAEQAVPVGDFSLAIPNSPGIETKLIGQGTGRPHQKITVSEKPVQESSFRLFTIEDGNWLEWRLHHDFDASGRSDSHFLLDPTQGVITLGDGERGRVVPDKASIVVSYRATRAEEGNLADNTINKLAPSIHNQKLLELFDSDEKQQLELIEITNSIPADGGSPAEKMTHAAGRAIELIEKPNRAVTLADCEALAMETPGVRLARVSARANLHPDFPCFKAPAIITVIILPYLPAHRPMPSRELQWTVAAYLARRRVIGTRIEVVGPTYLKVAVRAQAQSCKGTNKADIQKRIKERLNRFFHPIIGGPDGKGWPFGRDVYRSEVLQVIDETPGVDHVLSLELIPDGGTPQCGNICLGPTGLVVVGQHQIEVM